MGISTGGRRNCQTVGTKQCTILSISACSASTRFKASASNNAIIFLRRPPQHRYRQFTIFHSRLAWRDLLTNALGARFFTKWPRWIRVERFVVASIAYDIYQLIVKRSITAWRQQ